MATGAMTFPGKTVLMDMSGMYGEEGFCPDGARVLDLRHIAGTRCMCDDEAIAALRSALAPLGPEGVHWIDGGDWHYLSLLWIEKIREPFILYLFDNHPDDQPTSFGEDVLSCGSWVLAARRTLPCLAADVWNGEPSLSPDLDSLPAYISIDLDVLAPGEAWTNWDQGTMTLSQLKDAVSELAARRRIIGIDVCGGVLRHQSACACDQQTNLRTRLFLQEYFDNISSL